MAIDPKINDLFERALLYPDENAKQRFDRLVGLDDHKNRLSKMLGILVNPEKLSSWFDRASSMRLEK